MAIPEIRVSFCLFGDFDPTAVSVAVGLEPDRTWRAGDARVPHSPLTHTSAGWCIEERPETGWELEPVVSRLLDRLAPFRAEIQAVRERLALRAQLACVVYADDRVPALGLGSQCVARLAELEASLDIDVMLVERP